MRKGQDPQLEKAIEIVMAELAKNPVPKPKTTGVSDLPQEAGASDDASEAVSERTGGRPSDNRMIQPEPLKETEPLV